MKILSLHCDYIKFQPKKKAVKTVADLKDMSEVEVKEPLGIFVAVEKSDEISLDKAVDTLVENALDLKEKTVAERIVLYPYAHLSADLSKPDFAESVLVNAEEKIKKKKIEIVRAPFGYYKTFELKCKGHPLSELTRRIDLSGNGKAEVKDLTEDERKRMLHEISKSKLDTTKLKDNDHRILGQKMDLWSFNTVAPGMVFWHPKGLHIKNKLIELWRDMHKKAGYLEISTPQIMDRKLWEISGHWTKYSENNFKTLYEGRDFLVKPMNCPGGMLVYKTTPKSYKDLPLRVGELGIVHRVELSGVLAGLFRVIQFTQDDAHIFCTEKQLEQEIGRIIELIDKMLGIFKIKIDHVNLSTRPEKRIGSDKIWDLAEKELENVLKKRKMKYVINKGDGAFYGPKIDFHIKDSLDRTWQCATIQLDMALPERFDLTYTDEKGEEQRPIMLHRVIYGSLERFIGVVTEELEGNYPLWMSPNQIKVMSLTDDNKDYAKKVYEKLLEEGFNVELDDRSETMGKKVREAQIQRFNYIVTVGEKEEKAKKVAVKTRGKNEIVEMSLDKFIGDLKEEIKERK
jgi:threonyl-tRNA synthetase